MTSTVFALHYRTEVMDGDRPGRMEKSQEIFIPSSKLSYTSYGVISKCDSPDIEKTSYFTIDPKLRCVKIPENLVNRINSLAGERLNIENSNPTTNDKLFYALSDKIIKELNGELEKLHIFVNLEESPVVDKDNQESSMSDAFSFEHLSSLFLGFCAGMVATTLVFDRLISKR